ncbi:MAG: hypothetical protein PVF74_01740 [Anaerolineales bacterium]
MSDYDYLDDQPQPRGSVSGVIFNVLTVLVLLMVVCVTAGFLAIFINPDSDLNPFPPPTLPPTIALPTSTPTPRSLLPETWTPSPSPEPTMTFTPEPSATPFPTETPFPLFTATFTPEGTLPPGGMAFVVGAGTPIGTSSAPFHPDAGCNWLGVAGQVFDLSTAPISGQQIRLGGTLAGTPVDMLSLTGLAGSYGSPGFYEFVLGDTPIASQGTLWVQLQDQAGLPMSEKVYFDTYDNCEKNLVFINFQQVR